MRRSAVNPFASPDVALSYEAWYETTGRRADRLEKALLMQMLARFPQAISLLEVGCGTGHFTRWFKELGLQTAGLDRSLPMLAEAIRLGSVRCIHSDTLALPFSTAAFDLVALITTLEFVSDPVQALGEALRVCRQGLLLGVLNRQSLLGWQLTKKGRPNLGQSPILQPGGANPPGATCGCRETNRDCRANDAVAGLPTCPAVAVGRVHWHGCDAVLTEEGEHDRDYRTGLSISFATGKSVASHR